MLNGSLAEQIAALDSAAPQEFDTEAGFALPEYAATNEAREHYVDVGPSALRQLRQESFDPKYSGIPTSRKQLDEESYGSASQDSSMSDSDEGMSDRDENIPPKPTMTPPSPSETLHVNLASKSENDIAGDISQNVNKTHAEDRTKGVAVLRQITLWDTLLDARIGIEKAAVATNRLPLPSIISEVNSDADLVELQRSVVRKAVSLSEEIFRLRENLIRLQGSDAPPSKRRKIDPVADELDGSDLKYHCEDAALLEQSSHSNLVQTLNKWSAKVQAVAPAVLLPSYRNTFLRKSQAIKTAVQLVDDSIVDGAKLRQRTQLWRGKELPLALPDLENNTHEEIFDDTEYYQQLLRDLIDSRGANVNNDWMAAQKQRKAKKAVDTRASKGRKLRYHVHEKLQNFMVPITMSGSWHEQQIDELFSSLLGRGNFTATEDLASAEPILKGFRLF